jgi:hypothetical protein
MPPSWNAGAGSWSARNNCSRHPEVRAKRASKGDGPNAEAVSFEGRFAATSG